MTETNTEIARKILIDLLITADKQLNHPKSLQLSKGKYRIHICIQLYISENT